LDGKYVDVKGQQVYYEEYGKGEPLLLMHGGFGTGDSLLELGQELAKHFRVIAPDRTGHGHTADTDAPFRYEAMATEMIGFLEALGIPKAHLVGYSDGGILCLVMALQRPEMISRMVPIAANFHFDGLSPQMAAMFGSFTLDVLRAMLPEFVETYEKYSPDGSEHAAVWFEKTKTMFGSQPRLTTDDLAKINVPTLVLAADRDLMTIEHTVALFEAIPNAQLCIIPGATHELALNRVEDVSRAALRFLTA
jgi:pimeloyl-ACP methyl ester carboxylesterase